MQELRANTEVIVHIGPFVDVGDGFTPQTDIALSGNEAELQKHGVADTTVDISGNTWAAITGCRGWYSLTLTAGNLDTPGCLTVIVQDDSDCLPVKHEFMVLTEYAWDAKYRDEGAASGLNGVVHYGTAASVTSTTLVLAANSFANDEINGCTLHIVSATTGAGQSRTILDFVASSETCTVDAWTTTPTGTITYVVIAGAPATATVASMPKVNVAALSDDETAANNAEAFFDGTGYAGTGNTIPTVTTLTGHTVQTGDNYARLGAPAGASVSADIAAIKATLPSYVGLKKNVALEDLSFPMLDGDGDLVSGETVTVQIQKDGGSFAALTGSVDEVGSTGVYQVTTSPAITATEMNADQVMIKCTSTNAKPTIIQFYTESP